MALAGLNPDPAEQLRARQHLIKGAQSLTKMDIYMYICTYINVCMYVCVYLCMYVCMCVYIYIDVGEKKNVVGNVK